MPDSDFTLLADLSAIARKLKRRSEFRGFVGATERLAGARSVVEDIAAARQSMEIFQQVVAPRDPTLPGGEVVEAAPDIIGGALFVQALIRYSRGTQTNSKGRRGLELWDKFKPPLKGMHERLMTLRNDAVAHFGLNDGDPAGFWVAEAVVLAIPADGLPRIAYPNMTAHWRNALVIGLIELIGEAERHLPALVQQRSDDLVEQIEKLLENGEFRKLLVAHRFDAEAFFGSSSAVNDFYQVCREGRFRVPNMVIRWPAGAHSSQEDGKSSS